MYVWSFLYEIPKHKDSSKLYFKKPNIKKIFWLAEEKLLRRNHISFQLYSTASNSTVFGHKS